MKRVNIELINNASIFDGTKIWDRSRTGYVKYEGGMAKFMDKDGVTVLDEKPEIEYRMETLNMNLPFNEFVHLDFEITGSLAFRDFMFIFADDTARFAMSNRFLGNNLEISSEYLKSDGQYWNSSIEFEWRKYHEAKTMYENKEMDYDNFRLTTPYSASTKFWVGINLKDLCRLLLFMHKEFNVWYEIYGSLFFNAVDGLKEFFTKYAEGIHWTPEDQYYSYFLNENPYGDRAQFMEFKNVGMILFSQIERQSKSICRGYIDVFRNKDPREISMTGGTILPKVEIFQTDGRFSATIKTRACWFSMSDASVPEAYTWSTILKPTFERTPKSEWYKLLPCEPKNGCLHCKYKEDTVFRNLGTELQNPPCAFLMENRALIEKRRAMYGDSPVLQFYDVVWDQSGMKENPNNPLSVKYKKLVEERFGKDYFKKMGVDTAQGKDFSVESKIKKESDGTFTFFGMKIVK